MLLQQLHVQDTGTAQDLLRANCEQLAVQVVALELQTSVTQVLLG